MKSSTCPLRPPSCEFFESRILYLESYQSRIFYVKGCQDCDSTWCLLILNCCWMFFPIAWAKSQIYSSLSLAYLQKAIKDDSYLNTAGDKWGRQHRMLEGSSLHTYYCTPCMKLQRCLQSWTKSKSSLEGPVWSRNMNQHCLQSWAVSESGKSQDDMLSWNTQLDSKEITLGMSSRQLKSRISLKMYLKGIQ